MGLFYFSGNDVKCAVPVGNFNYNLLKSKVNGLEANSNTPHGVSLAYAEREIDKTGYVDKSIVLLTDGMNNIGESPQGIFQSIIKTNESYGDSKTNLYIIAFNTDPEYFNRLKNDGAVVYEAKDGSELSRVLKENAELILEKIE